MTTHFLHIGKTGGSAIKDALSPIAAEYGLVLHSHKTRLSDIPIGEGVFFVLRDPIDRFVSGFVSRQRKGQPRYDIEWSQAERKAFSRYPTPNSLAEDLGSREAAVAMAAIAHVRSSLRDWFNGLDELDQRQNDIRLVLFQESLAADFEELKHRLGLPAHLALPEDNILAHRTPKHFDTTLSPLAIENLRDWYSDDIGIIARLRSQYKSNRTESGHWWRKATNLFVKLRNGRQGSKA